ncbi:M23 family metallopeptidase [Microbacterium sp. KNMS]
MSDDLKDVWAELRAIKKEIRRNRTPIALEDTSIHEGTFRLAGGRLYADVGGTIDLEGRMPITAGSDVVLSDAAEIVVTGSSRIELGDEADLYASPTALSNFSVNLDPSQSTIWFQTPEGPLARMTMAETTYLGDGLIITAGLGDTVFAGSFQNGAVMHQSGARFFQVEDKGVVTSLVSPPSAGVKYRVIADANGLLYRGPEASGSNPPPPDPGGEGGDPGTGTYALPVPPEYYPIPVAADNFQDHVNRGSGEPGTDFWTPQGTPVYAVIGGTITLTDNAPDSARGRVVELRGANGSYFAYLHLSSIGVTVGQTVTKGQYLGRSGGSGWGESTYGKHLHLSMWAPPNGGPPPYTNTVDFETYL